MDINRKRIIATIGLSVIILSTALLLIMVLVLTSPMLTNQVTAWWYGGEYLGDIGVIMQDKQQNCGPAALKMVFDHFGIQSSINEIEELTDLSEKGTSMLSLKELAEFKGLRAEGWRYTVDDFINAPKPALLFIRGNHYIIADSLVSSGSVYIRDPARGRYTVSLSGLKRLWNGETLIFYKDQ